MNIAYLSEVFCGEVDDSDVRWVGGLVVFCDEAAMAALRGVFGTEKKDGVFPPD